MKTFTLGIVALGGAGRAHYKRFSAEPRVDKIFGYDQKKVSLPGLEMVSSLESLLEKVDAVSICSPDYDHYDDIVSCLKAGKHILVEKPMVSSVAEADELEAAVKSHPDKVFAIHHQMRYVPAFERARELIAAGVLGEIFFLEANYWHDMRQRSMQFDDWRMAGQGQSVVFAHGCHPYDLLMWLLGEYPDSHTTYANKNAFKDYPKSYTSATTMFKFPSGTVAKCNVNNCCIYPQLNDLIVLGDKASYVDGLLYSDCGKFKQLTGFVPYQGRYPKKFIKKIMQWNQRWLQKFFTGQWRRFPLSVYSHDYACHRIVENFVKAVLDGDESLVGFEDGRRVIRLCQEIEESVDFAEAIVCSSSS